MAEPEQKKGRRWVRVVLWLSLGLNLLILGMAGGAVLRFKGPEGMRPPPRSFGSAIYRAMPEDHRDALRVRTREIYEGHRSVRKQDLRDVSEVLRTTPFDISDLRELADAQSQARDAARRAAQDAWLEKVAAMSDTERAAYADRLEKIADHKHTRRH